MATITGGASRSIGATVRQVTKSNFPAAIHQIKTDIEAADFVAVSTRKTGDSSASSSHHRPWRRILPIDTPETAYLKSKLAAGSFELLQFAVCPFSIRGSKVIALPYNFHLFPRDELSLGMPSYRFSCQTPFLASMAREGFDFNACVYDGISYLSRVQESKARERNPSQPSLHPFSSSQTTSSVADSIFKERIKWRINHWRNAFKASAQEKDGSLAQTLRKLILGGEVYGSRPGMSIDICNERQMHLVFEVVNQISDDLVVPIYIPHNIEGHPNKAVRVVLAGSEDDKKELLAEIQDLEDEQNLKLRGFRQVIDLISSSHKTVVSHNCLHDFTFIHEKFLGPLPATVPEFMCSLRLLFDNVIDLNHLLKEIGPLGKGKNIPGALSYLRRQFFLPMELQVPRHDPEGSTSSHGKNVLSIAFLFSKLNMLLKTAPSSRTEPIEDFANIFHTASMTLHEPGDDDDDAGLLMIDTTKRVGTDDILFLWGFRGATSAAGLKARLFRIHPVFSKEFDVRIVDKTCAIAVFRNSGSAEALLKDITSVENLSGAFRDMVVEGLRAARYDAYKKVCKIGLWEGDLADSLEVAMADSTEDSYSLSGANTDEIHWNREMMIDLNEL
ncbi:Poly(A)-specific ribonuclease PARN-like [Platanthera guangdongensis]|uniref:Poly(A)-specific ribonuclease PARN-like n=1 Tax=Platanthera guangdongensis TaxID=2320717 RepID=A0ABR2LWK8_9ASPA